MNEAIFFALFDLDGGKVHYRALFEYDEDGEGTTLAKSFFNWVKEKEAEAILKYKNACLIDMKLI